MPIRIGEAEAVVAGGIAAGLLEDSAAGGLHFFRPFLYLRFGFGGQCENDLVDLGRAGWQVFIYL